jgi:hypothetical protein
MTTPNPPRGGLGWSDDQLARGRRLVHDLDHARFELGDLAIEIAGPSKARGHRDGSYAVLANFASEIGMGGEDLARFRSVASAWPPDERIEGATWTLHRSVANRPDRHAVLADFIAEARREGFNPTRSRLIERLRQPERRRDESEWDYWIAGIARGTVGWVSAATGEKLPWTLQRRREIALVLAVEAGQLGEGHGLGEVLDGDEALMGEVLAVGDVLPAMREAFGTWVARVDGDDVADAAIDPGRLPDVEALAILWRAMLHWSMTPDGQTGWAQVVAALQRRIPDPDTATASPLDAVEFARHLARVAVACLLSGREDLRSPAAGMLDGANEVIRLVQELVERAEPEP